MILEIVKKWAGSLLAHFLAHFWLTFGSWSWKSSKSEPIYDPKSQKIMSQIMSLNFRFWLNYDPKFGTNMSQSWLISEPNYEPNRWSWILEILIFGSFMSQLWLKTLWSRCLQQKALAHNRGFGEKKIRHGRIITWAKVSQSEPKSMILILTPQWSPTCEKN